MPGHGYGSGDQMPGHGFGSGHKHSREELNELKALRSKMQGRGGMSRRFRHGRERGLRSNRYGERNLGGHGYGRERDFGSHGYKGEGDLGKSMRERFRDRDLGGDEDEREKEFGRNFRGRFGRRHRRHRTRVKESE